MLQAIAATVLLATVLWTLGVPSLRFAEAANVTTYSDTLSDSAPSAASNHTITFTTPNGMAGGEVLSIIFPTAQFSGIGSLDEDDFDLTLDGSEVTLAAAPTGATWGVVAAGDVIDFTAGSGGIASSTEVVIEIGSNATEGATGVNQITNPAVSTSYEIDVTVGDTPNDTGSTRVMIVDSVTVTASVDTVFTFTVNGVTAGTDVNGILADETGGDTTATAIPFGELVADTASTAAQQLLVDTNAANGFVVTVQADQQLTSSNGAVIDSFIDGATTTTPTIWQAPGATPGQENEYGHWALTSSDVTVTSGLTDEYNGGTEYVAVNTAPVEVFRHDGPIENSEDDGNATVLYKVEVTALQEAAEDYTATLTYVATPVF